MTSNIKVIDINEEDKQEGVEQTPTIEEATEEVNEVVVEPPPVAQSTSAGLLNNPPETEEVKEEEPKPKTKAKPKLSDKVDCNTCGKSMSLKNYKYRHEKLCTEEPKPVKPQAKPKAKVRMMPKPKFKEAHPVVEEEVEEEEVIQQREALPVGNPKPKLSQPVKNQILKPTNPLVDIASHYQLLQNEYMKQKQAKYQNLCQNMFAPKSKKKMI